jgi:amino acid permease
LIFHSHSNNIKRYWKDPGAFTQGGLGIVYVLLSAGYSFLGSESGRFE